MLRIFVPVAIAAMAAAPAMAQSVSPSTYVAKAGASDQYEIQSSRLVLATTQDAKIRDFANQMIADHTKSTADVKAAARQTSVRAPAPKLEPMQARNIAALRAARGTARDTLYMQQQQTAHQMALDLHSGYASNGTAEPLKAAAATIVPVVQSHIQHLQGGM